MIEVMLPVQYLRQAGRYLSEPQKRLMLAVLHTVVHDCRPTVAREATGHRRRAYEEAMAYVASRDRTWPYSFENVCEAIGVDADYLRRGIDQVGACAA